MIKGLHKLWRGVLKFMENEAYVTTYWQDFGIAEHFGASAIKDTYRQAVKCWGGQYRIHDRNLCCAEP